jgi:hypothetical protein
MQWQGTPNAGVFSLFNSSIKGHLWLQATICDTLKGLAAHTLSDYRNAVKTLTNIQGIGFLSGQHILAITALCSIIDPAKMLSDHYNIIPFVAEKLYKEIADGLGVTVAYVENLTCEYPR